MGIQEFLSHLESVWRAMNEEESVAWVKAVREFAPSDVTQIWDWIVKNYSSHTLPKPGIAYRAAVELGIMEERQIANLPDRSCGRCLPRHLAGFRYADHPLVREGFYDYPALIPCECAAGQVRKRGKAKDQTTP